MKPRADTLYLFPIKVKTVQFQIQHLKKTESDDFEVIEQMKPLTVLLLVQRKPGT